MQSCGREEVIGRHRSEQREEGRGNYEREKRRTSWWILRSLIIIDRHGSQTQGDSRLDTTSLNLLWSSRGTQPQERSFHRSFRFQILDTCHQSIRRTRCFDRLLVLLISARR